MKTKIYAHRGASAYCPENTIEAFSLAIEQGAEGFELDVHLTKDGHVVVTHDERLERVSNGTGFVKDHTLDELKTLNFSKNFTDRPVCRIPTLDEVYSLVKSTGLMINVELKTTEFFYLDMPQKLIDLERDYSMTGRILYSSFNHYSLSEIKKIKPDAEIGLLYSVGLIDPWVYAKYVSAGAIHPYYSVIGALPGTVDYCHANGIDVNVWTVDDPNALNYMFKCGVDIVITNKPDLALKIRSEAIEKA